MRDKVKDLLLVAGAVRFMEATNGCGNDDWMRLACLDRLVETGEITEVTRFCLCLLMNAPTPLDPNRVICVIKHNGREVGRVAATTPNASSYIQELVTAYGGCQVEDANVAMISRMLSGGGLRHR